MLPRGRFLDLWRRLTAGDGGAIFDALAKQYDEPHRHYHTATHIAACLALFDEVAGEAAAPDEIEAAIWFHDAVYDTRAMDNEEQSARQAEQSLVAAGAPAARAARVAALVRATRGHEAEDPDMALLIGIDLSILGAPAEEFDQFDAAIRGEYAWVEEPMWRAGRSAVLRKFVERTPIYETPGLRERFEDRARENLARAIARLAG